MVNSIQYLPPRIGIIGDIHAESIVLRSVLDFLSSLGLQTILCTGDIVDGSGSVDECVELLKNFGVASVRGNHDKWLLGGQMRNLPSATQPADISPASLDDIRKLPVTMEFQTTRGRLLLCHGIGANDMARLTPDDYGYAIEQNFELHDLIRAHRYRFMIGGHTHRRMVRTIGGLTIINAGTLKQAHEPCFLMVDFEAGFVQFYNIGAEIVICEAERLTI